MLKSFILCNGENTLICYIWGLDLMVSGCTKLTGLSAVFLLIIKLSKLLKSMVNVVDVVFSYFIEHSCL